jgi:hypothetical protein
MVDLFRRRTQMIFYLSTLEIIIYWSLLCQSLKNRYLSRGLVILFVLGNRG